MRKVTAGIALSCAQVGFDGSTFGRSPVGGDVGIRRCARSDLRSGDTGERSGALESRHPGRVMDALAPASIVTDRRSHDPATSVTGMSGVSVHWRMSSGWSVAITSSCTRLAPFGCSTEMAPGTAGVVPLHEERPAGPEQRVRESSCAPREALPGWGEARARLDREVACPGDVLDSVGPKRPACEPVAMLGPLEHRSAEGVGDSLIVVHDAQVRGTERPGV